MTSINIGISEDARKQISDELLIFLSETYGLYAKTHNFHWNVTGPEFDALHKMFETHYNELWTATDDIAERIRALGQFIPGDYAAKTTITLSNDVPVAHQMIQQLIDGHETVLRAARTVLPLAQQAGDEVTVGLLVDRMGIHEKTAWMLRSLLE